jgi:pimeloyl-ACP methyl ester carboxylesterase
MARPTESRHEFVALAQGAVELWCDGDGPTVVFLSGIGGDHTLMPIGQRLTPQAYSCFYDRPGDGPPPPDQPRTAGSDAAALHGLFAVAGIPTPAVLVAHSYGSLIAIIAATKHPEDIAGVVFVDPSLPDQNERLDVVLTDSQRDHLRAGLADFPFVDWPTSAREPADSLPSFPSLPVTVISGTRTFIDRCEDGFPCAELQAIWLDGHVRFAATLTPDARHVLANTGHYVQEEDPDLVELEVRTILARLVDEQTPPSTPDSGYGYPRM